MSANGNGSESSEPKNSEERKAAAEAKRQKRQQRQEREQRKAAVEAERQQREQRKAAAKAKRQQREQRKAAAEAERQASTTRSSRAAIRPQVISDPSATSRTAQASALDHPQGAGSDPAVPGSPTLDFSMSDRPVVVYGSAAGIPPLRPYANDLWARRHFLWHLTRSDLKSDNYDTALGQVWLLLNPLLMAVVYLLVRGILRPGVTGGGSRPVDFLAHLVMGIFFFQYTAGTVTAGSRALFSFRGFVLNTNFPRAIFPMEVVLKEQLKFLPAVGIIVLVQIGLSQPITWALLWVPLLFLFQTAFNLGLALIFAPLLVFHRDLRNVLNFLTRSWFFLTPIIYMTSEVPENLLPFMRLNPLFPLFAALENVFSYGVAPTGGQLLAIGAWSIGAFVVGMVYFLRSERRLTVRL